MDDTITVKKIKDFEPRVPKKSAFTIETSRDLPKMNQLMVFSGKRGGGKSVALTTFIARLLDEDVIDRVIMITPTYLSNKEIFKPLKIKEDTDVIEPTSDAIKQFIALGKADQEEYTHFLARKKLYKEFLKSIKNSEPMRDDILLFYDDLGFFTEPPKWKYPTERPPRIFLVIDDCMGTPLMNPKSGLMNLCIKHRHIWEGVGCSIAMLVQSYCAVGGLPRPIRENCSLLVLFKCKDDNQIHKIHQEIGADIPLERFDRFFKYATEKPYGFLVIDFNPKTPEQQFRSGWNEYLY